MVVEDRALLHYRCRTCGVKADTREELKHEDRCVNRFGIDRVCAKSGRPPHDR